MARQIDFTDALTSPPPPFLTDDPPSDEVLSNLLTHPKSRSSTPSRQCNNWQRRPSDGSRRYSKASVGAWPDTKLRSRLSRLRCSLNGSRAHCGQTLQPFAATAEDSTSHFSAK